jgi:hypothetical protein
MSLLSGMADTLLSCSNPVRLRRRAQADFGINALESDPEDVQVESKLCCCLSFRFELSTNHASIPIVSKPAPQKKARTIFALFTLVRWVFI